MATALAALTAAAVITDTTAPSMGVFNRYDATAGSLAVTLPALAGLNVGARCAVQKGDTSINTVTFTAAGSDTFTDTTTTSFVLPAPGAQREIQVVSIGGTKYWEFVGSISGAPTGADFPLDVTVFGAVGDGATDDSAAIQTAVAAMTDGAVLYFPAGSYRFADTSPTGGAAIVLAGLNDVAVLFDPGAELLMDNLVAGDGSGHGVYVKGACSNIILQNVRVRWASAPNRSTGDGFRILGYPSDSAPPGGWTTTTGPVTDITLINCETIQSPGGTLFAGCSDVRIVNYRAAATAADGLHFNACRRATVNGYHALDTGDDCLAYVTYYHATDVWQSATGPFNQPALGEWSNTDCAATGITVSGGAAAGIRVSGSNHVAISNATVDDCATQGVVISSCIAGGLIADTIHASRASVSNVMVQGCDEGLLIATLQIDSADDAAFWQFDCHVTDLTVRDCPNWAVLTQGDGSADSIVAGVKIRGVNVTTGSGGGGNGSVGFLSIRDSQISDVWVDTANTADVAFYGMDTPLVGALSGLPANNVMISNIHNNGGRIIFQDMSRAVVANIQSNAATADAVWFVRCTDFTVGEVTAVDANRGNTGTRQAVGFFQVARVTVGQISIIHDDNATTAWYALVIGGGDATNIAADGLRIDKFVYVNALNQTGNDIVLQGGPYAPVNYLYHAHWFNGGEASPVWRTAFSGSTPLLAQPVPVRSVAGAVSDASFDATPVDGTLALDSTGPTLYARVGGAWKSVGLT